jgi:hypothetical protein
LKNISTAGKNAEIMEKLRSKIKMEIYGKKHVVRMCKICG